MFLYIKTIIGTGGDIVKVINKTVDVIAYFDKEGNIRPVSFRSPDENGELVVVKVDRLVGRKTEKIAGTTYIAFRCQSVVHGIEKVYELRFNTDKIKWVLSKM